MQATTGTGSCVAHASVLGGGGGGGCGVGVRRPWWDGGVAGGGGGSRLRGFGVVRCCVQEKRPPRVRKTKEERREMVESFVNTYRVLNDGKFPSVNLTHKEVGGSYYIVREIVRDIIQENRVLGPGGLNAKALSFEDCPDPESPVTHELGQDSVQILDMSDEDQVGEDTAMDREEVWSSQNNVMSTQQLLGSSNLVEASILNSAVQNGKVAHVACLETSSGKQDEVPCAQSIEIDPISSENQSPSFSHAPDSKSECEMDSQVDSHVATSSLTNGVVSSAEPNAVSTNGSLLQDHVTSPDDCHDGTSDSAVDEAVNCLQPNGVLQASQTLLHEHETIPESVMSNDVQIIDGQFNSTSDAFNSNTSYPVIKDTAKSIEVSEVQRLQDEFEQSTTVADPDQEEKAESLVSHSELDAKVLSNIEDKHGMVEEDNSELKQTASAITAEEHGGKAEHGDSTTTAISRHALCLLTLRCMLTVYNFLHAKTGKVQPKKETNLFWLIIRAFVVAMSKIWAK
uniref:AT3G52170-like helix-turn-helix domain-containing protein n=1 Tax=Leersia perrieri TaxID=77586 RepID=A0A0D9XZW7_9ORYZ